MAAGGGTRALSFLGGAERRRVLFEQLDHGAGFGLVGEPNRDALAVGRAHAGDGRRLPIGLPEHMPDGRNLFHHVRVDPILSERSAGTRRATEPLRKKCRPAFDAGPDCNAWFHSARSNAAAAAVSP